MSPSCLRPVWTALLLMGAVATSLAAIEVPFLRGRITDDAEIISPQAAARISEQLAAHESATSDQVAVLTIPSLEGEAIETFAQRVFNAWKLGRRDQDNGVLLVIAPQDRRMRVEVGYGLESRLTDLEAGRIIRNIMAPRFRAGDFSTGVEEGVAAILGQLRGDGELPSEPGPTSRTRMNLEPFDMPIYQRFLIGAFVFGIIGLFTVIGILTPGAGWFLYFFLIPFWAIFPIVVIGARAAVGILISYLLVYPVSKLIVSRQPWYHRARKDLRTKDRGRIGGMWIGGGGARFGTGDGGSSSEGGFSGGGGGSGGGGASGSW